jgi:hypothetical protein
MTSPRKLWSFRRKGAKAQREAPKALQEKSLRLRAFAANSHTYQSP